MQRKEKQKVIDEVWTPERVRSFLELAPPANRNADFHRLLRAYQSMRAEDFADFVTMFVAAGVDLSEPGPYQTVFARMNAIMDEMERLDGAARS